MLPLSWFTDYAVIMRCPLCQSELPAETAVEGSGSRQCATCGATLDQYFNETESVALEKIGRFTLLKVLGEGGFGTVYHARDAHLEREVALKTIRINKLGAAHLETRLIREAKAAGQLTHPGIVKIFDQIEVAGMKVLIEEYIEGDTLESLIKRKKLTPQQSVEIVVKVAEALDYAHEHKVFHRDIKPANIIVDAYGQPRILDFGLAKREGMDDSMTEEGQLVGTLIYMSPEQANGQVSLVKGASDQYSLAIILYQMLTGELPFRGTGNVILRAIVLDEPPSLRSLKDSIPRDLENICLKAISKKISDRYSSCGAFAADLKRYLRSEPVEARPVGMVGKLARWTRRNRTLATSLVTIALVLLLATGVSTYFAVKSMSDLRGRLSAEQRLLLEGDASEIRPVIQSYRSNLDQHEADLQALRTQWKNDPRKLSRLLMTLNVKDPSVEKELFELMLQLPSTDALLVHDHLHQPLAKSVLESEWQALADRNTTPSRRLLAAVTLGKSARLDGRWTPAAAAQVVNDLLDPHSLPQLTNWQQHLEPVYVFLQPALQTECLQQKDMQRSTQATTIFLELYGWDIQAVAKLLEAVPVKLVPLVVDHLKKEKRRDQVLRELRNRAGRLAPRESLIVTPSGLPIVPDAVQQQISRCGGMLHPQFALCAAVPWGEVERLLGTMADLGYRPTRCRPYTTAAGLQAAVVWHRDYSPGSPPDWVVRLDLNEAQLKAVGTPDWEPVELSAYEVEPTPGVVETRFVWIARPGKAQAYRVEVKVPEEEYDSRNESWLRARSGSPVAGGILDAAPLQLPVLCSPSGAAGRQHFSQIVARVPSQRGYESYLTSCSYALSEARLRLSLADFQIHHELRWAFPSPPVSRQEYLQALNDELVEEYELNGPAQVNAEALLKETQSTGVLERLTLLCARRGKAAEVQRCLSQYAAQSYDRRRPLFLEAASTLLLKKTQALPGTVAGFESAVASYDDSLTRLLRARLLAIAADVTTVSADRQAYLDQAWKLAETTLTSTNGLAEDVEAWWSRDLALLTDKLEPLIQKKRNGWRFVACWSPARLLDQQAHFGETIDLALSLWQRYCQEEYIPHTISVMEWQGKPRVLSTWRRSRPLPQAEQQQAVAQAQVRLALHSLENEELLWNALRDTTLENRGVALAQELVFRSASCQLPVEAAVKQLTSAALPLHRYRLLLLLGQYPREELDPHLDQIVSILAPWLAEDPDPGVHAACDWLLRRWERKDAITAANLEKYDWEHRQARRWCRSKAGNDFVIFDQLGPFYMGLSVDDTEGRQPAKERPHVRKIGHGFALGACKVTRRQYAEYDSRHRTGETWGTSLPEMPVGSIRWHQAAAYCNWLSEKEGIPRSEWCYEKMVNEEGMQLVKDSLLREGYRLPTEAELEYAQRGSGRLIRPHGNTSTNLEHYAWYRDVSSLQMHPVGLKCPTAQGLFDAHGNAWEWTNDIAQLYPAVYGSEIIHDECWHLCAQRHPRLDSTMALRGMSWAAESHYSRCSQRHQRRDSVKTEAFDMGFRVARTLKPKAPPP
jgi:serine/threonine protein kinase/formylglycine-generating enzyme required for sulfatase activity